MNPNDRHEPDPARDELTGSLRQAVDDIRHDPLPAESMHRALQRARGITAAVAPPRPQRSRRLLMAAGLAALVLLGLGLWLARPAETWAQVAKAVQAKPWLHGTAKGTDGQLTEFWFAPQREVSGARDPYTTEYYDHRLRIVYTYEPKERVLYRVPDDFQTHQRDFRTLQDTFGSLFRADPSLPAPLPGADILEQKRQRVVEDGRQWLDYDLTLRHGPDRTGPLVRVVFRVDPESHLPQSMKVTDLNRDADRRPQDIDFVFDYPDKGPNDIYDLGVPRAAKLIDRVPPDDLNRTLAAIKAGQQRFDPYQAIVVQSSRNGRGVPVDVMRIWRNGRRWRVENGVRIGLRPPLAPDEEGSTWLWQHLDSYRWTTYEVCDGTRLYDVEFAAKGSQGSPKGTYKVRQQFEPDTPVDEAILQSRYFTLFPDLFMAYPNLPIPSEPFEGKVDAHPQDGPPDTILLTVRCTQPERYSPEAYRWERYWLDPTRNYVVVRREMSTRYPEDPDEKNGGHNLLVAEKLDRSPQGLWYPTLLRSDVQTAPDKKSQEFHRFYLDFKADMPERLFKPTDR